MQIHTNGNKQCSGHSTVPGMAETIPLLSKQCELKPAFEHQGLKYILRSWFVKDFSVSKLSGIDGSLRVRFWGRVEWSLTLVGLEACGVSKFEECIESNRLRTFTPGLLSWLP